MNYTDKQLSNGTKVQMQLDWNVTLDKAMWQPLQTQPFPLR